MIRSLVLLAVLVLAAGVTGSAAAAAAHPGDPAVGRIMVYTCHGCHGIPGYHNAYPNYPVPKIAGQHYQYLVTALNEYRSGDRAHPTMRTQAESLSEADIANIAAYLSSLKK